MRQNKKDIRLFISAFMQVLLVSANTYFISKIAWIGIAICGFGISYLWTINVKKIAFSNVIDRVIYSSGAMLGGITGVYASHLIFSYCI